MAVGSTARIWGRQDDRSWDERGEVIESGPERVVIRTLTDPTHLIQLRPRHGGVRMGDDQGNGHTICSFVIDGNYVAIASYKELPLGVFVNPGNYSPAWVYAVSEEEMDEYGRRMREVIRELGGD